METTESEVDYGVMGLAVTPPSSPYIKVLLDRNVVIRRGRRGRRSPASKFYDSIVESYNLAEVGAIVSVRVPLGTAASNLPRILSNRELSNGLDFQALRRSKHEVADDRSRGYAMVQIRKLSDRPGVVLDEVTVRASYASTEVEEIVKSYRKVDSKVLKYRFSVDPPDWGKPLPPELEDMGPTVSF